MRKQLPRSGILSAIAILVLCWLIFGYPWLSGGVTIPYDAKALFQAQLQFLASAFHKGESILWNPYAFVGMPQIADPQSLIFSPAILIASATAKPSFWILDCYVLLLLLIGGLAVFAYCTDRGWHPSAGVLAGLVFATGGSAYWRIQHIAQIKSYVFLAIALWLLQRTLQRRSYVWGALYGVAVGAMISAPDQVALLSCYGLVLLLFDHVVRSGKPVAEIRRLAGPLALSAAVCFVIAAIPLLLVVLFLSDSNRPTVALDTAVRGSLPPVSLLTAIGADIFGIANGRVPYWGPFSEEWDKTNLALSPNMVQLYWGQLPMLLIVSLGLIRRHLWDADIIAVSVLGIFATLYALGNYTPAYELFYHALPGVSMFRRPVDATFMLGAALALSTGYAAHLWLTNTYRRASQRLLILELALWGSLFTCALYIGYAHGHLNHVVGALAQAITCFLLSALVLLAPAQWFRQQHWLVIAVPAALLTTDLAINNRKSSATAETPSAVAHVLVPDAEDATIRFLSHNLRRESGGVWRDRVEMVGLGFDWQNCATVQRMENVLGYNPLRMQVVATAIGAFDYNVGADQRRFTPLFPSYKSRIVDMLGVRYIASGMPLEAFDKRVRPDDFELLRRTSNAYIYFNPRAKPRVHLSTRVEVADFGRILETGRWPDGFEDSVVLVAALDHGRLNDTRSGGVKSGTVKIVEYGHGRIEFAVNSDTPTNLVLNDVWHPWWFATVDGADVPIVQANIMFRAVPVPAGTHVVRMEFKPIMGAAIEARSRIKKLSALLAPFDSSAAR